MDEVVVPVEARRVLEVRLEIVLRVVVEEYSDEAGGVGLLLVLFELLVFWREAGGTKAAE